MEKPYVKKLGTFEGFDVWYVDGPYIRKSIEKDFVGYADHFKYNFIPEKEFWIEEENSRKEWRYFVKYFLAKIKYYAQGKKYRDAINLASDIEQKERDKSKIVQKLKKEKNRERIIQKIHKKLLKAYSNENLSVWIVNGFLVRSLFFLDFTSGGHDKVYNFVSENEVWLDDALTEEEMRFVLLHELHERNHMKKGMNYEEAHILSNGVEKHAREHPELIEHLIKKELDKNNMDSLKE